MIYFAAIVFPIVSMIAGVVTLFALVGFVREVMNDLRSKGE